MKILITGMGGSGKSEICKILKIRGFTAFDGDDVSGLARWEDENGNATKVDHTKFSEHSNAKWNWNSRILQKLLTKNDQLFLCGSSSNEFDFFNRFDKVFVLVVNSDKHHTNLINRSSSYGKDPLTIDWILSEHPKFVEHAINMGAVGIDANGTPEQTADLILSLIYEN